MLDLLARLVGGTIKPLTDQVADVSARFVKKLALFVVAAVCMLFAFVALTVALCLWVSKLAGPIVAALSFAGVYLAIAIIAVIIALYGGSNKKKKQAAGETQGTPESEQAKEAEARRQRGLDEQIDRFVAPLLRLLQQFGFRREQLAVLAGASMAKQIGPLPLVGLAIVVGFLVGRLLKSGRSLRSLLSFDAIAALLSSGLFGFGAETRRTPEADPPEEPRA